MPIINIGSLDDQRLDPYRHLTSRRVGSRDGSFIAEGWLVVERLLRSRMGVRSVVTGTRHLERLTAIADEATDILVLNEKIPDQLVGYKFHAGVLAEGIRPPNTELTRMERLNRRHATLVICPHASDPDNLGSMIRSCAAFGVDGLVLTNRCADPFSRRSLRLSMGNAFFLPIYWTIDLHETLAQLKSTAGFTLAATVADGGENLSRCSDCPDRLALLFGNEGDGLEAEVIEQCDLQLTIEMARSVDSLNVATTAAIALHHFLRRV